MSPLRVKISPSEMQLRRGRSGRLALFIVAVLPLARGESTARSRAALEEPSAP